MTRAGLLKHEMDTSQKYLLSELGESKIDDQNQKDQMKADIAVLNGKLERTDDKKKQWVIQLERESADELEEAR